MLRTRTFGSLVHSGRQGQPDVHSQRREYLITIRRYEQVADYFSRYPLHSVKEYRCRVTVCLYSVAMNNRILFPVRPRLPSSKAFHWSYYCGGIAKVFVDQGPRPYFHIYRRVQMVTDAHEGLKLNGEPGAIR